MKRAWLAALLVAGACAAGRKVERPFTVDAEAGAVWQSRNDVQIPGTTGTRFDLTDVTGSGPWPVGRLTFDWDITDRHAVRAVWAPLEIDGTGTLGQPTSFAGGQFAPDVATDAKYKFSSYRLTYRYTFLQDDHWRLRVGGTAFIRDAKIQLTQPGVTASDSDVGFVPLLHLAAQYRFDEHWRIVSDLDGAWSPNGRAFDFTVRGVYDISDRWAVALGYRTIEGGADNDSVYNFAWLHFLVASVAFRF